MSEYKGAWHGDPALKAEVLERMIKHRQEDEIIQGHYRIHDPETASGYKGCLVGCTLPGELEDTQERVPWDSNRVARPREGSRHRWVESLYGIPHGVVQLLDDTFEEQRTFDEAAEFAGRGHRRPEGQRIRGAHMKTRTTLGVIVGNRGFFPSHLCEAGRAEVLAALEAEGIGAVALAPDATPYGAVESLKDARK